MWVPKRARKRSRKAQERGWKLHKQVNELRNILNEISNSSNQAKSNSDSPAILVKSALTSSCSSITKVQSNHIRLSQATLGPVIPQLDGGQNTPQQPSDQPLQCETCHEIFATEDQFNDHDNAHQFCCDECFICYTTQVLSDLHELEAHPNTHYANTYIPQSTKLLFASGQPIN